MLSNSQESDLLSRKEVCRIAGIGKTTFFKLVKQGELKTGKIGRKTVVSISELEAFIERIAPGAYRADWDLWHSLEAADRVLTHLAKQIGEQIARHAVYRLNSELWNVVSRHLEQNKPLHSPESELRSKQ